MLTVLYWNNFVEFDNLVRQVFLINKTTSKLRAVVV